MADLEKISEEEMEKNEPKSDGDSTLFIIGVAVFVLGALSTIIWALLPNLIDPTLALKIVYLCVGFFLLILLASLELKTTGDFLGVANYRRASKKNLEVNILNVGKWIVFSYIALTFLFAPYVIENLELFAKRGLQEAQEPTVPTEPTDPDDIVMITDITEAPASTYTPVPEPNNTLTPEPIGILEPTPTSTLFKYKVGVFEQNSRCGDKDKNNQIISGLKELGFNANQVPIETSNDYAEYDVLYMPYGWSCTQDNYDFDSLRDFLELPNTGLLIGDPKPDDLTTLRLFSYKVYFDHLSPESASLLNTPEFIDSAIKEKFYVIFRETSDNDLPVAESKLTITNDAEGYFRVITQSSSEQSGNQGWYNSFIASANEKPRFAIMPGSEYNVSDNAIPAELMINIIKWLAHARVGN